jgi:hypothetical protein
MARYGRELEIPADEITGRDLCLRTGARTN